MDFSWKRRPFPIFIAEISVNRLRVFLRYKEYALTVFGSSSAPEGSSSPENLSAPTGLSIFAGQIPIIKGVMYMPRLSMN